LRRQDKERDASRGSPRSFGGQKRPPQDDNLAASGGGVRSVG